MKRRIWHILPSAALIALLALVARAQTGNRATHVTQVRPAGVVVADAKTGVRFVARGGTNPRTDAAQCDDHLVNVTATSTIDAPLDGRVLQAMYVLNSINGVTLSAGSPLGASGTIGIELVDPVSGAPINTFPLSRQRFSTGTSEIDVDFHDVVTRRVQGVETGGDVLPALSLALDPLPVQYLLGVDTGQTGQYDQLPVAYDQNFGFWAPMTGGPHMVAGHSVCTRTAVDELWVGEQRIATEQVLQYSELLQSFVCPVTITAEWVELAVPQLTTAGPIQMLFFEDDGSFPPTIPPNAIAVELDPFASGQFEAPAWMKSSAFAPATRFRKGQRMWAVCTTNGWSLAGGADPSTVTALYGRVMPTSQPAQVTGTALAFRHIGRPTSAVADPVSPTAGLAASGPRTVTITATYPTRWDSGDFELIAQPLPPDMPPIEMLQLALVGLPRHASSGPASVTTTVVWRLSVPGGSDPDDETYPLAYARSVSPSATTIRWTTVNPTRPVVSRSARTVTAQEVRTGVFVVGNDVPGLSVGYDPDGASSVTLTARFRSPGGGTITPVWKQLPGPTCALGMVSYHTAAVATPTAEYAGRVRVTEAVVATPTAEILQTFRVPTSCQMKWVELAIPGASSLSQPLEVIVLDSQGQAFPGSGILQPTPTAGLLARDDTPPGKDVWMAAEFPSPPILQPNHEYWLVVRTTGAGSSVASSVTITAALEGDRFFHRPGPSGPFLLDSGRSLSFRVIATPYQTTAVDPVAAIRRLEFSVSPNPASQSLMFRWKGGSGRVSLEIVDVSGRRVRRVADAGPGTEGSWRWDGMSDSGDKLPAGVYFARLTGPDGNVRRRVVRLD